jgi:hypothetical protein
MIQINLSSNDIFTVGLYLSALTVSSGLLSELRTNRDLPLTFRFQNNLRASSYVVMACTLGKTYLYLTK